MKKILFIILGLFILCGCNKTNSLIESNYIANNSYETIYQDLSSISNEINYYPTKDLEIKFYEMIEVIRDNYDKFTNEQLENIYNLININYNFRYNENRYNNENYYKDLKIIEKYLSK